MPIAHRAFMIPGQCRINCRSAGQGQHRLVYDCGFRYLLLTADAGSVPVVVFGQDLVPDTVRGAGSSASPLRCSAPLLRRTRCRSSTGPSRVTTGRSSFRRKVRVIDVLLPAAEWSAGNVVGNLSCVESALCHPQAPGLPSVRRTRRPDMLHVKSMQICHRGLLTIQS
jgi:hypothetical protein